MNLHFKCVEFDMNVHIKEYIYTNILFMKVSLFMFWVKNRFTSFRVCVVCFFKNRWYNYINVY